MLNREETSLDRSRLSRSWWQPNLCAAIMVTTITIAVCLPDTSAIYGTCTNFDLERSSSLGMSYGPFSGTATHWPTKPRHSR